MQRSVLLNIILTNPYKCYFYVIEEHTHFLSMKLQRLSLTEDRPETFFGRIQHKNCPWNTTTLYRAWIQG